MSGAIYVLIMVFCGSGSSSFTQEFTNSERCEVARSSISTQSSHGGLPVVASGCYKK